MNTIIIRRFIACLSLCSTAVFAQPALPPLRILVGFPPGGGTDGAARLLAEKLGPKLNRTVLVENKPGAGGAIAATALKHSPPNGQTLMLAAIVNISIYPSTANPPAYEPFTDLTPVSIVGSYDLGLAVSESSGVKTLPEFVAWTKANPSFANFGSPGNGSLPHLFGAQLAQATGVDLVHVPYQGAAPSVLNLLGGQVGSIIQPLSDLMTQASAGKLRILAITASQRRANLPDVPTFKELGIKGMEGSGWIGLFAPAGTPDELIKAVWQATQDVEKMPTVSTRMEELGFDTRSMSTADFDALTRADAAHWSKVVAAAGISASPTKAP